MNLHDNLSESLEDYLEAIFHIETKKQAARAKDIAESMNVSSSSVTGALRLLSEKGLVNYAPYDLITLTPSGKSLAEDIAQRHSILRDFFVKILQIQEKDAELAACRMEHGISGDLLDRITQFITFLDTCPDEYREWLKGFDEFYHSNK